MFDANVVGQIVLAALLGGVIGLDRTAAGQVMISQPIVAAPLTGWLLGDAAAGLVIGAVLEPIWVLDMPIGTFVPADSTIAAVMATAIASIGGGEGPARPDVIGFCILLTVAMAPATMAADSYIRKRNAGLASWVEEAADLRLEARVAGAQAAGVLSFFLKIFLLCLVIMPLGLVALHGYALLPAPFPAAMATFLRLLPILGAALIIRRLSREAVDRYVLFGLIVALIATQLFHFHPAGAVLCALIAGWLGVRYRER